MKSQENRAIAASESWGRPIIPDEINEDEIRRLFAPDASKLITILERIRTETEVLLSGGYGPGVYYHRLSAAIGLRLLHDQLMAAICTSEKGEVKS